MQKKLIFISGFMLVNLFPFPCAAGMSSVNG